MKKQTLLLPAGTEYLEYKRLAKLLADAMHPGHDDDELIAFAAGAARVNFDRELRHAALHGILPLRDPLTLAPSALPMPKALVSVYDLRVYLTGRIRLAVEGEQDSAHAPSIAEVPKPQPEKDIGQRNARWLRVFDEEETRESRGAQARAARRIAKDEGVQVETVRKAIRVAEHARAERFKREGLPHKSAAISSLWPQHQPSGRKKT